MAIMTEEERALQYGRYAPRSDFNVRPMSAVDTTSKYEKIKPDTREADAFISSMRTAISNYSSAYEQAQLKAASEQENQLFGAYERSVNDLRIQYEAGKLNPTQYSRLMAQLDNNILKQGVDVSKFNTVRSAIGGNMSQQATAAALKEQAKNEIEFRDKRIQELQSAFPAYKNKSYDELGAIYDRNVAIYKRAEDLNNILNDPSVTKEQRQSMLGDSIRTGTDLGIIKSLEYIENWIAANPDELLNKVNFNDVEAGVHNMLKSAGYKDEALITTMVEAATANLRQAANLNIGYINDATAHSKEMLDYLQNNRNLNIQSNYPLLAYVQGSKDPGAILGNMEPEQIKQYKEEQERYIKEYGPYTEKLIESYNKAQVIDSDNGNTPLNLYNSFVKKGMIRTVAPDMYLTAKANANSSARKAYANSDNGGLFQLSQQDLATAKDNLNKVDQLNKTGGAVVASKGLNQAIVNMCDAEVGCVEAAKNVLAELTNPTTPLSQAAEFMRGSIQADRLRLTPDGQVVLTKDKGWGQSIAEVFETTNYMEALSAVNRYLANQRTPQAKAYAATAMFGEGLKMLGSEEVEDFGGKWIKGTTSAAVNTAGGATRAVSEWSKEREQTARARDFYRGTIDLDNRPVYTNEDGSISSEESITVEQDGKYYVIPTIRTENGKRINMTEDEAVEWMNKTGEHLGVYDNLEAAERAARIIHNRFDFEDQNKMSQWLHRNPSTTRRTLSASSSRTFNNVNPSLDMSKFDREKFERSLDDNMYMYADVMESIESTNNPNALSGAGAKGLMQMLPETFEDIAKRYGLPLDGIWDPEVNKIAGTIYMQELFNRFNKDVDKMVAAYNCGPTKLASILRKYPNNWKQHLPEETKKHIIKFHRTFERAAW